MSAQRLEDIERILRDFLFHAAGVSAWRCTYAAMTSADEYKRVALELLEHFSEITKEHMAMSEVLRSRPALTVECRGYLPQAKQAVDSVFAPLRRAIESGTDIQPALEALLKLP